MAISYVGIGALAQAVDSITPAYPGGAAAGDLAVLQVTSGSDTESTPTTPSGWQSAGTLSGGTSPAPRRTTFFVRELAGGDAAPTTEIPADANSVIAGRIHVLSRSTGVGWRWGASFGADTTSDTSFSAACVDEVTWAVDDFAILGYSLGSGVGLSAEAITATGITYGTVTERADHEVIPGGGGAARFAAATCAVTAGSGTEAPTITATLSGNRDGTAGVLRVRETFSDVTAVAQTAFPPRNLVSVTGMVADDIVSATVYRETASGREVVRAAEAVDVTGIDSLLRIDAEQPFGVAHNYAAELTDVTGSTWTVYSGVITSTVAGDVISDAVRGIGAIVQIASWPEKRRDRDAAQFNVGGRIVVVSRPRSSASATVLVRTHTEEDGDALEEVLAGATEGVVLIRKQVTLPGADNHVAVLADSEDRNWYDPVRRWSLDVVETEPWPTILEAAGFTLQDVADNYSTLQDLADDNATLLALAQRDFGV